MSTVPEVVTEEVRSPSILSLAVAPGSVKISPRVRLIVEEPVNVIIGGTSKLTTIILIMEEKLPSLSVTEYTMVYVPAVEVSNIPEIATEEVRSPSVASVAVTPGSMKTPPISISIIAVPVSVITGGKFEIVSGNSKRASDKVRLKQLLSINIKTKNQDLFILLI